jgi:hypothetical protein
MFFPRFNSMRPLIVSASPLELNNPFVCGRVRHGSFGRPLSQLF